MLTLKLCFLLRLRRTEKRQVAVQKQADLLFFLVRKPALCAQVRGIFADADAIARRKVR